MNLKINHSKMFENCTYYYNVHHPILTGVIERESISRQGLSIFLLPSVRTSKNNTKKLYLGLLVKEGKKKKIFVHRSKQDKNNTRPM